MNLTEKIKQILSDKAISPSIFADEIGVQRSSMSHILAGRNKPSLEMVQKIVRRYPDLGLEWIMEDNELPEIKPETATTPVAAPSVPFTNVTRERDTVIEPTAAPKEKKVDKIIIFYTDGTFRQFKEAF